MQEIYSNISNMVKKTAESAWHFAIAQNDPIQAANFLNNVTNYYKHFYTEEEIEFLQFYFNSQLEMMKK